jgi:hypothetical protein
LTGQCTIFAASSISAVESILSSIISSAGPNCSSVLCEEVRVFFGWGVGFLLARAQAETFVAGVEE